MNSEESIEEIEVLSAIYGSDFEHRNSAWNLPSFILRIKPTPHSDGSCFVSMNLIFILPKQYPKIPPKYEIEGVKGLSEKVLEELKDKLQLEALSKAGQVMCYELATIAKDHLEVYNRRPQNLFDSMTSRHQREEDALRRLRADSNLNRDKGNASGYLYMFYSWTYVYDIFLLQIITVLHIIIYNAVLHEL
jgi:hypothetical protein